MIVIKWRPKKHLCQFICHWKKCLLFLCYGRLSKLTRAHRVQPGNRLSRQSLKPKKVLEKHFDCARFRISYCKLWPVRSSVCPKSISGDFEQISLSTKRDSRQCELMKILKKNCWELVCSRTVCVRRLDVQFVNLLMALTHHILIMNSTWSCPVFLWSSGDMPFDFRSSLVHQNIAFFLIRHLLVSRDSKLRLWAQRVCKGYRTLKRPISLLMNC